MEREDLQRVVQKIAPGGRLIRNTRLHGGIASIVHRLDVQRVDGTRTAVALRYSAPGGDHAHVTPEKASYEFKVLNTLRGTDLPTPEPVLLDAEGELLGVTAVVASYIPGKPRFGEDAAYMRAIARALASVHAVTPTTHDLTGLRVRRREELRERVADIAATDPYARRLHSAFSQAVESLNLAPPSLVHGDFWAGNVIWSRRRVSGIIDWGGCYVGDHRADVAEFRIDLTIRYGPDAADSFRTAYEQVTGQPLQDPWFFDLWRGGNAYAECEEWLEGLWALGLTHLTATVIRRRLKTFLDRALRARPSA